MHSSTDENGKLDFQLEEASTSNSHLIIPSEPKTRTTGTTPSSLTYKEETKPENDYLRSHQYFDAFAFDEAVSANFYGRRKTNMKTILYSFAGVASLGLVFLLSRWLTKFRAWLITEACDLIDASHILIINSFGQADLVPVTKVNVPVELAEKLLTNGPPFTGDFQNSIQVSVFDYRCNRFIQVDQGTGYFQPLDALLIRCMPPAEIDYFDGWTNRWIKHLQIIFGTNEICLEEKSAFFIFLDQLLNPFYIFQIMSFIIWLFEYYYLYAVVILLMATGSAIITVFETKRNMDKMRQMARHVCQVKVVREGSFIGPIPSSELVPGDVLILDEQVDILPCDAFVISGDAIIDESVLTGETVPISKSAMPFEDYAKHLLEGFRDPRFAIYGGTKALRSRSHHGRPCMALVTRTGFLTAKGNLVQAILFPRPNNFRFYRDSMLFIAILSGIAALGFTIALINFIRLGTGIYWIFSRALDIITVVVPPALPATMAIGTVFAIKRLEENQIYCISPPRINIASKIQIMCFDKTGTLTEEGLEILGVKLTCNGSCECHAEASLVAPRFGELHSRLEDVSCLYLIQLMATCHGLRKINGRLMGDSLDLRMLAFSKWDIDELTDVGEAIVPTIVRPMGSPLFDLNHINPDTDAKPSSNGENFDLEIGIIRQFNFDANLRRMSVIVRSLREEDLIVFTKGSPESIYSVCCKTSIPSNYSQTFSELARQGYRVIGCAMKKLPAISWFKAQKLSREEAEVDLIFLGFIVFENRLKEATFQTISTLKEANISSLMATGDNILTAVSVARACGMIDEQTNVFYPVDFSEAKSSRDIKWICIDDSELEFDPVRLRPCKSGYLYKLAITGNFFEWIRDFLAEEYCNLLIKRCTIYARMSPQQKQSLVECLQAVSSTEIGFCGDGANDCGALKAADVGISLSQAEASIAAPFTSKAQDISCVPIVLKEGRASLVTSFCCFKYMTLYSMIQFTTLIFLYSLGSTLSDGQFVWIDLFLIVPLGILMSRYSPAKKLSCKMPPSRLVSRPVLLSILGHIIVQAIAQASFYFFCARPFGNGWSSPDPNGPNTLHPSTTLMFLFSSYFYIYVAALFSAGKPFREAFYLPFTLYLILGLTMTSCVVFLNIGWLNSWLLLVDVDMKMRLTVFLCSLGYGLGAFFFDRVIISQILKFLK